MADGDSTVTAVVDEVQYREIPGYPGYRAGSDGTIWSCWKNNGKKPRTKTNDWHILKPRPNHRGYHQVKLFDEQRRPWRITVHKIVLITFVGPAPDGMECRHFPDNTRTNNRLENLSWGTKKQNQADRIACGTDSRGEKHPLAKFSHDQVRLIRERAANGEKHEAIAESYGVRRATISYIVRRKHYSIVS